MEVAIGLLLVWCIGCGVYLAIRCLIAIGKALGRSEHNHRERLPTDITDQKNVVELKRGKR